jgi:hypothetical protein
LGIETRQAKIVPKKRGKNEEHFEDFSVGLKLLLEPECSLLGHKKTYMTVFDQKFTFFITLFWLWIRIQKQPGSGSGRSKMTGSGSRFTESGSETLLSKHLKSS